MRFKSVRIEAEWASPKLSPLLRDILIAASGRALERWEWEFFITCIYRTPEENDALYGGKGDHLTGVHPSWRGVDVRILGVDPGAVLDVTTTVNDSWVYDPAREGMKVALLEGGRDVGSTGAHLHFQVSPATARRALSTDPQDTLVQA